MNFLGHLLESILLSVDLDTTIHARMCPELVWFYFVRLVLDIVAWKHDKTLNVWIKVEEDNHHISKYKFAENDSKL